MCDLLSKSEKQFVLTRDDGEILGWTAVRGYADPTPEQKWTPNPDEIKVYDSLEAGLTAAKRLREKYPDEFRNVKLQEYTTFKQKNQKTVFSSIAELKRYYPKATIIWVVEDNNTWYFTSQTEKDEYLDSHKDANAYRVPLRSYYDEKAR
jgi:hypothetical protein